VRRDNMLLHLLFKALFELSSTRAEYVSNLLARPLPGAGEAWRSASLERIISAIDAQPTPQGVRTLQQRVDDVVTGFGVPLTAQDRATIQRFHQRFIDAGLDLKFQSFGRPPRSYYPSYRELLLETDLAGKQRCFLASDEDYAFVRRMQQRNLIIPVVGNVAGPSALAAIGRAVRQRGDTVSAFYVSNVELYLFQNGIFDRYAATLRDLPRNPRSVIVRSIFVGPVVWDLPTAKPGYASASVTQLLDDFAAHHYGTYAALISK
jgi:hypothetical protein